MEGEVWRDVPSVPGVLVSSEGRVMLLPYRKLMHHGGERSYGGQPVRGVWNKTLAARLVEVRGKTHTVTRLIAEAFLGPPPFATAVARHVSENAADNRATNVRWGTRTDRPPVRGLRHRPEASVLKGA
jgi:hypothetical protein